MTPMTSIIITLLVFVLGILIVEVRMTAQNNTEITNMKQEIQNGFPNWCPLQSYDINKTDDGYEFKQDE